MLALIVVGCSDLPAEPGRPGTVTDSFFGQASGLQFGNTDGRVGIGPSPIEFGPGINNRVISVTANDTVVYNQGYYSIDGSEWVRYNMSGKNVIGNWIVGPGSGSFELPVTALADGQDVAVVAYTCEWVGAWNCHGNVWQRANVPVAIDTCDTGQCVYDGTCYNAGDQHPIQNDGANFETICQNGEWTTVTACGDMECGFNGTCYTENDVHPAEDSLCLGGDWRNFPASPGSFE
jgi:hypothetical protein